MNIHPATARALHRWLALIFSLSALVSSSSGVLHILMTWTQSPPPTPRPLVASWQPDQLRITAARALAALPAPSTPLRSISICDIGGTPWYRIQCETDDAPFYVNATTGVADPRQDEAYAAQIASRFLGGAPVRLVARLTAFDREYISIFRLLPVYRFDADDGKGTRVYVSTQTGSVARHTDNHRQFEANIFSNLHKLSFITHKKLRDSILAALTAGVFVTSLTGIVLFVATRSPRKRRRLPLDKPSSDC